MSPFVLVIFTTIRLCVADYGGNSLSPSVNTTKPQDQLDTIAREFKTAAKEGGNLTEIPIRDGEFQLRYIGKDQDMPFYMVLARQGKKPGMGMSTPNPIDSEELQRAPFDNVDIDSQYQVNRVEGGTNYLVQTRELPTIDNNEPQTRRSSSSQCASDSTLSSATPNKMQPLAKDIDLNGRRLFTNHQRSLKPQALCLTIALTKESFIQQPYVLTGPPLDVKIDVFFNGVLSASTYVSERIRNSDPESDDLILRFSGLRVAQKIESSWVLVPPGQTADGKLRDPRRTKGGSKSAALSRWTDISKALHQEATVDANGTIIGQYLASLSELEMPVEAETLHSTGGPKYGIIDVVLTAGRGSKKEHAGIEHISEPTRMRVVKPRIGERKGSVADTSKAATSIEQITAPSSSSQIVTPRSRSFADANIVAQGYTDTLPRDASKLLRTSEPAASLRMGNTHTHSNTRLTSRETSPRDGAISSGRERLSRTVKSRSQSTQISPQKSSRCLSKSQNKPQDQTAKVPQKTFKGSEPILEERPKQKRSRIRYYSELTTKLTAEEEIAQIEAQSKESPAQPALDSSPAASTRRQSARVGEPITPAPKVMHSSLMHASKSQKGNSHASSTLGKRKRSQSVSAPKQRTATEKVKPQELVQASLATRSKVVTLRLTRKSLEGNLVSSGATPLSTLGDNEGRPTLPLSGTPTSSKISTSSSLALSSQTPTPDKVERDFGASYTSNKVASGRPKLSRGRSKDGSEASVTTTPLHKQTSLNSPHDTSSPYMSTRSHPNPPPPPLSPALGSKEIANSLSHRDRIPRLSQENLSRLSNVSTPMGFLPPPKPAATDLSNRSNRIMGPPRPAWTMPALSEDCVITFAPDGFRPVKLERTGWFREYCILLGVRFLVG